MKIVSASFIGIINLAEIVSQTRYRYHLRAMICEHSLKAQAQFSVILEPFGNDLYRRDTKFNLLRLEIHEALYNPEA